MNTWHVLTDGRLFWGQAWEMFNNSPRRPRSAMAGLQDATLCSNTDTIEEETRRAWEIVRVVVQPVPVRFVRGGNVWRVEVVMEGV